LDDHQIQVKEIVLVSRKLGAKDAAELANGATLVVVAKGAKVSTFSPAGKAGKVVVGAMLGPTGNLRAPCIRVGKTVLVGFHADTYRDALL